MAKLPICDEDQVRGPAMSAQGTTSAQGTVSAAGGLSGLGEALLRLGILEAALAAQGLHVYSDQLLDVREIVLDEYLRLRRQA